MLLSFFRKLLMCASIALVVLLLGCDGRTRTERQMDDAADAVGAPRMDATTREGVRKLDKLGEAAETINRVGE